MVPKKHNREHGHQRSSATLYRFIDMLRTILQKNNSMATTGV
jgi:hypothetical protein